MILSSAAVIWLVLRLTPWLVVAWLAATVVAILLGLAIWGRHLMIGRYRVRRRQWPKAIESFQRFEKMQLMNPHASLLLPLYLGIYTLDGVALARNHIAQALIHLNEMDDAEGWSRSALQRDPLYPLPHVNLGIIAATRNQEVQARREFQKAVNLGFNPALAQQLLARALRKAKAE